MNNPIDFTNLLLYLLTSLIGGIVGTYFGFVFRNRIEKSKITSVREIAKKGLNIIKSYAPSSYKMSESEFNKKMKITEKRIVLVALHKLGMPISLTDYKYFDIKNIAFEDIKIDSDEIDEIIGQIDNGNCDELFFLDPDTYFNNNLLINYKRDIAKRYVNNVFSQTRLIIKDDKEQIEYPKEWKRNFSQREIDILSIVEEKLCYIYYYDQDKKIPKKGILEELRKEIDIGLWDIYLDWSYDAYLNMKMQQNFALSTMTLFQQNFQKNSIQQNNQ